jgi:hypothetical protein
MNLTFLQDSNSQEALNSYCLKVNKIGKVKSPSVLRSKKIAIPVQSFNEAYGG